MQEVNLLSRSYGLGVRVFLIYFLYHHFFVTMITSDFEIENLEMRKGIVCSILSVFSTTFVDDQKL